MNRQDVYKIFLLCVCALTLQACAGPGNTVTPSGSLEPIPTARLVRTATPNLPTQTPILVITEQPNTVVVPSVTQAPTNQATYTTSSQLPTLTPRPPGVDITSPSTFSPIRARTELFFAVNAMSPAGLDRVELYIDDRLVASKPASHATEYNLVFGWQTEVNGDYRIQARAVDANGNILQSGVAVQPVRGGVDAIVNGTPIVSPIGSIVSIPEGTFTMGDNGSAVEEKPQHAVHLTPFEIDRYPVTVGEYREYIKRTQFVTSAEAAHEPITRTWRIDDTPERWEHPVRFVSWWDADAYCRSMGKLLPTEAQWEYAARGADLRRYPWGNDFDKARVPSGDTAPVGFYPSGVSPFGLYDMAGNVWQWTADWFDPLYYGKSDFNNPVPPQKSDQKTLRGGGYNNSADDLRVTRRIHNFPTTYHADVGFRCVKPG